MEALLVCTELYGSREPLNKCNLDVTLAGLFRVGRGMLTTQGELLSAAQLGVTECSAAARLSSGSGLLGDPSSSRLLGTFPSS